MFDDRQYRTDNPCGDGESLRCEAALSDDYTMLGRRQERWVEEGLDDSRARWSIVGQQLLLAELEHLPYEDERYWNDAWDGYPMARQRLLETVVDEHVRNPVFFTGDWHSTFVNDLKLDFKDPAAPTVATEFVTPAITTGGDDTPYGPYYAPMVPYNPHIKYYEGDRRGYMKATVTKKQLQIDLRFVTSVERSGWNRLHRAHVLRRGRRARRHRVKRGGISATVRSETETHCRRECRGTRTGSRPAWRGRRRAATRARRTQRSSHEESSSCVGCGTERRRKSAHDEPIKAWAFGPEITRSTIRHEPEPLTRTTTTPNTTRHGSSHTARDSLCPHGDEG